MTFKVGDKVIKNPDTWVESDFDSWGRGQGFGIIIERLEDNLVDVRWPGGKSYEDPKELSPALVGGLRE